MVRPPRNCPVGIPQHVRHRGCNGQDIFASDEDRQCYMRLLSKYSTTRKVDVHAWVLMTNHTHLLVTPQADDAVSNMMHDLGGAYGQYFNRTHARTGGLFEDRYKNSAVETDVYLLTCQRYIELNPVRAGLVDHPGSFSWSSYHCHAFGANSEVWSPHDTYQAIYADQKTRQKLYRNMCEIPLPGSTLEDLRRSTSKNAPFGSASFKARMKPSKKKRRAVGSEIKIAEQNGVGDK